MMRHADFFKNFKDVHIRLKKNVHLEMRKKMFERGLTMQWAFEEFAMLIIENDQRAKKILDNLAVKRIKDEIKKHTENIDVNELDRDTLYNLIEDNEKEDIYTDND